MIDWLLNNILYGGGTEEGLCFVRGFLRDRGRLIQCSHDVYIWRF